MNDFKKFFGGEDFLRLTDFSCGADRRRLPHDVKDSIYFYLGRNGHKGKSVLRINIGANILLRAKIPFDARLDFLWSRKKMMGGIEVASKGYKLQPEKNHGNIAENIRYSQLQISERNGMPSCDPNKHLKMENVTIDQEHRTIIFNMPVGLVYF